MRWKHPGAARREAGGGLAERRCLRVGFSPDICALTSSRGFHCFLRAEGGRRAEERLHAAAPIGPELSPPLPLSPAHHHPPPPLTRACVHGSSKVFPFLVCKAMEGGEMTRRQDVVDQEDKRVTW